MNAVKDKNIVALASEGTSYALIAATYGLTKQRVHQIAKRHGSPARRVPLPDLPSRVAVVNSLVSSGHILTAAMRAARISSAQVIATGGIDRSAALSARAAHRAALHRTYYEHAEITAKIARLGGCLIDLAIATCTALSGAVYISKRLGLHAQLKANGLAKGKALAHLRHLNAAEFCAAVRAMPGSDQ